MPDYHAARLQRAHPLKLRINRVGFTVAKKLGVAVVRNRVKRILREAYYKACKTLDMKTGKIIVIAKYIKDNNINAKPTADGLYIIVTLYVSSVTMSAPISRTGFSALS